jgi:uncharacterized membrane protein YkoI
MKRVIVVGAIAAGLIAGGTGIAIASGQSDDGPDRPITGPALEKAKTAALDHTGGGHVTGTEAGDEEGAYEVEITMPDDQQVDVHLNKDFTVIGSTADTGDTDPDQNGR